MCYALATVCMFVGYECQFFVKVNEALVNFGELLREKAVVSRDSTGL